MLSYYLSVDGPANADRGLLEFFRDEYRKSAQVLSGVIGMRVFIASKDEIAVFNTDGSPRFLAQLLLNSGSELESALATGSLADFRQADLPDCAVSHQLFRLHEYQLTGSRELAYGKATQSMAVRYYSNDTPEAAAEFREAYLASHPAAWAEFPGIQRIFCYEPEIWDDPSGITPDNSIVGNEVVFDNMDHLIAALLSPAMAIVGNHSNALPRFKGWNTHYPMTLVYEWFSGQSHVS